MGGGNHTAPKYSKSNPIHQLTPTSPTYARPRYAHPLTLARVTGTCKMKNATTTVSESQKAFLLAKEYATAQRDNASAQLYLIAQENLLTSFFAAYPATGKETPAQQASKVMRWTDSATRKRFTDAALLTTF